MPRDRGRGGPINVLFGLVGQGVGMASEYRAQRKEQKEARSASQQYGVFAESGPSHCRAEQPRNEQEPPPAYDHSSRTDAAQLSDNKDPALFDDSVSSDSDSVADDSEEWELDDALEPTDSRGLPTYEESEVSNDHETVDDLVRNVVGMTRPILKTTASGRAFVPQPLPVPVVLPQRRPRKKARGFVRAYAPVLDNCGIDQDTFLRFLKNFHNSSQASPVFPVIRFAAVVAGFAPSVIAMAVCIAAEVAAGVGEEVQGRMRTNNFLDRMNEELFKPAGLFVMIVKYKTNADVQSAAARQQGLIGGLTSMVKSEKVDFSTNQVIAKYNRLPSDEGGDRSMGDRMKGLRLASDTTRGTFELPKSAPLIFPAIDHKMAAEGPETFKDKSKDAKKFLADYFDRRAQVQYASQDPNSSLAVPQDQRAFRSSLADPNHPMHSGGLLALFSGGKVAPRLEQRERRREKRLDRDVRRVQRGREPRDRNRYGEDYYQEVAVRSGGRFGVGVDPTLHSSALGGRSFGSSSAPMKNPPSIGAREGLGAREEIHSARRGYGQETPRWVYDRTARGTVGRQGRARGPLSTVKRIMREDVLYLLIVNMPSEEELAEARAEMAASH
ncbi:hypothetical protein DOTSEDRAFT_67464 [Dothistroma septosporum NZE10]|uniref:Uncharacterized protein n=1 Tax=Dothistroma septosporum (strain NZE10 / CBS 128990) TaxID=675120 RepID=N1Q1A2_DOTSN|nr:hypothetical protein DOTSEDRAFT_67464 [Dothistroma septosporum NZE10]